MSVEARGAGLSGRRVWPARRVTCLETTLDSHHGLPTLRPGATARSGWAPGGLLSVACVLLAAASAGAATGDPLIEAVRQRDHQALRSLVAKKGTNVNVAEGDGMTALHWAAQRGDVEAVELLLKAGAKPGPTTDHGITPLALACPGGSGDITQKLLDAGADSNAAQASGETPLMSCALTGNLTAVKALLARGAKPNVQENLQGQTALMWAAGENHAEVVQALIDGGAVLHLRSAVRPQERTTERNRFNRDSSRITLMIHLEGGSTALHFAARTGAVAAAEVLLKAAVDTSGLKVSRRFTATAIDPVLLRMGETAANGENALVIAVRSGHLAFAKLLLEKGADPNADEAGYAPLHLATLRGEPEMVRLLLKHGANPNQKVRKGTPSRRLHYQWDVSWDLVGVTPFFQAAQYLEVEIMQALAAAGADTTFRTAEGNTPLMAVTGAGGLAPDTISDRRGLNLGAEVREVERLDEDRVIEGVKVMLALGARVTDTNLEGDSAMHGAGLLRYRRVMKLLEENGGDPNLKNTAGASPNDLLSRPGPGIQ